VRPASRARAPAPGRRRVARVAALIGVAALVAALSCARRAAPRLEPPAGPFEHPLAGATTRLSDLQQRRFHDAWEAFEAGDLKTARRELAALLKEQPEEPVLLVGLGTVELAERRSDVALRHAAAAAQRSPSYPQAQLLAARAAAAAAAEVDAVRYYDQARQLYSGRAEIAAEAESYRSQVTNAALERARAARQGGRRAAELAALQHAALLAPQSARPLIELGDALLRHGEPAPAAAAYERAARISGEHPELFLKLAALLRELGQPAKAEEWERRARGTAAAPQPDQSQVNKLIERAQLSRSDLAQLMVEGVSLIGKLGPLARPPVLTDLGGSGAEQACLWVAALGLVEPRPNHTFAPAVPVQRAQLALALDRLLDLYARQGIRLRPAPPAPAIADLHPAHRQAGAIRRSVALGLLELDGSGRFQAGAEVSGAEAWKALERLRQWVGAD